MGIEVLSVAILVLGIVFGAIRGMADFFNKAGDAYHKCKLEIGRALLMGLELLVAADTIRTVLLKLIISEILS